MLVTCPECRSSSLRFKERGWFMRHLERFHGYTSIQALQSWFDNFNMELTHGC